MGKSPQLHLEQSGTKGSGRLLFWGRGLVANLGHQLRTLPRKDHLTIAGYIRDSDIARMGGLAVCGKTHDGRPSESLKILGVAGDCRGRG